MATKQDVTFTYKDFSDRKRKNLAILECIRRKCPISRTDIGKETGINIVSVSNYILNYIKNNLVIECGLDISSGGRRPELVKLNLENAYVVGVDIGPEKIVIVATDLGLNIKAKKVLPRPHGSMEDVLKNTVTSLESVLKEFDIIASRIKLIGIGASGVVDIFSGTVHDTDPERGRTKSTFLTLAKILREKFKTTTLIGNDATCAAFGELSLSPRTDISEMLYIYSDIGCGIIINGDIYCGTSGSAGEIQLLIDKENEMSRVLEVASYSVKGADLGVVQEAKKLVDEGDAVGILRLAGNDKDKITKDIAIRAAQEGDQVAKKLLQEAAQWLGVKVAYLINIFNPQLVVIGGGMEKAGDLFMDALIDCIKIYAFEEAFNTVKITPSFLGEDAIALGAAALSVRELFITA